MGVGEGSADKKMSQSKCLRTLYVVSCFKQMSQR